MNEAVMRTIVGDRSVDEVITWGKEEINDKARIMLQELCDQYDVGIKVEMVMLQDVTAPPEVHAAWNDVNSAEQEKDKLINEARTKYNTEVPKARGEADRKLREAEGYAIERVNNAKGEAVGFLKVYEEYKRNPAVTRKRIHLETLALVLPRAGRKLVMDEMDAGTLKLLNLEAGSGK
jgi:membrane protease subunit HflK